MVRVFEVVVGCGYDAKTYKIRLKGVIRLRNLGAV